MESSIPPIKSDKEFVESMERSRKRKTAGISAIQGAANTMQTPAAPSNAPVRPMEEQESTNPVVLPAEPSEQSHSSGPENKIDASMRNQISSSRATTVELDSLRDLMPKLRKEINTYSINECQLIKELEKKLPSCYEHKDVRLNIVLEEIQRLRLNRRRALSRLKESTVKIVELQARMELTSYEAGEVFWNRKISSLSDDRYSSLDVFTNTIEEKESKENFSTTPLAFSIANELGSISASAAARRQNNQVAKTRSEQGYLTEMASGASATYAQADTSEDVKFQKNLYLQSAIIDAVSNSSNNSVPQAAENATRTSDNVASELASLTPEGNTQQTNNLYTDVSGIDFEKVVAEAQKQAQWRRKITKKGILIAALPPAAVIGSILLLDWLTGIFSTTLGSLFGG